MMRVRFLPRPFLLSFGLVLLLCLAGSQPAQVRAQADANTVLDPALFKELRFRSVGPHRGGRVTAVAGHRRQLTTFYMGATGGGVWKTTDSGASWVNISDGYFSTGSIGAIDVAESNPNIIYVGTGSAAIRSNVILGRGVYKSTDAGKTWTFAGLRDVGQIGAMKVHPQNPDVAYVAALGQPFGPNADRGVFQTTDGGKTWKKVLFVNDKTGAVSIAMNPANPKELYAGAWRGERRPWTIISGGPASEGGIYKTADGGETWTHLTNGLPQDLIGKVGVDVSAANPNRVYAVIEAPGTERRRLPVGRRRRDLHAGQLAVEPDRAAVLLHLHRRGPEEREHRVREQPGVLQVDRRRARPGAASRRRTATTTGCGSTRTTRRSSSSPTTAART